MNKKSFSFNIQNLKFEQTKKSNYLPFSGTCLFANSPSQGIPSGGIDKPVAFPADELQKALDTMKSMGVNCSFESDGTFNSHNAQCKIGVVETAELKGNEMVISGGLWEMDFPDVTKAFKFAKSSLGFSVEVLMNLQDMGEYYNARNIEFTGVALLMADKAAFRKTYIAAQSRKDNAEMTREEFKKMIEEKLNASKAQFSGNTQLSASEQFQKAIAGRN